MGTITEKCTEACIVLNNRSDHCTILSEFEEVKHEQRTHFLINSILLRTAILLRLILCIWNVFSIVKFMSEEAKRKGRLQKLVDRNQVDPVTAIIPPYPQITNPVEPVHCQPPLPPLPASGQPKYQLFS